ncbi:hypothetical protein M569_13824 [Genlisea aurea]|uniref:Uncharacterized protein n=1 Tax=Genlisea aurea TaxID=192259 RepID=S8DMS3_9LAMI|nr:hypothetical protein M569_13824 [Genlisea aurea]
MGERYGHTYAQLVEKAESSIKTLRSIVYSLMSQDAALQQEELDDIVDSLYSVLDILLDHTDFDPKIASKTLHLTSKESLCNH